MEFAEFEQEVEIFDREEHVTFYNIKRYKRFKKTCEKFGIIITNEARSITHKSYYGEVNYKKKYYAHQVRYTIPKGVNAKHIWYLIHQDSTDKRNHRMLLVK